VEQSQQNGFFKRGAQGDMFGPPPPRSYAPKPEHVRQKLLAKLDRIREAEEWDEREFGLDTVIFPQMTNWLPPDEAACLRAQFEAELARLGSR